MRIQEYLHAAVWTKRHLSGQIRPCEIETIRPFLSASSVCFDVGAHAGSWTRGLSKIAHQGEVYAFEALPYYAEILGLTMRLLRHRNVTVVNSAVTEKDGLASIVWKGPAGRKLTGMTHMAASGEDAGETVSVQATTLDSFWKSIGEKNVDFIKCDVEGAELFVLRGARKLIETCRPVFYNELNVEWCKRYGYTPTDIFRFFDECEYTPFYLGAEKGLGSVDVASLVNRDVLFVPKERSMP